MRLRHKKILLLAAYVLLGLQGFLVGACITLLAKGENVWMSLIISTIGATFLFLVIAQKKKHIPKTTDEIIDESWEEYEKEKNE